MTPDIHTAAELSGASAGRWSVITSYSDVGPCIELMAVYEKFSTLAERAQAFDAAAVAAIVTGIRRGSAARGHAARIEMAQRLGRILRPKNGDVDVEVFAV